MLAWPWNVGRAEAELPHRADGIMHSHIDSGWSQSYLFGSRTEDRLVSLVRPCVAQDAFEVANIVEACYGKALRSTA